MNDQTRYVVENIMAQEGITTHTKTVRFIVAHYEDKFISQRLEGVEEELKELKKELFTIYNLLVFISESMSATAHEKRISRLYQDAVLRVE